MSFNIQKFVNKNSQGAGFFFCFFLVLLETQKPLYLLKLANYISDLLYRYECVIVPDFGGFVTNTKSASVDTFKQVFHPPYKQITFNSHLKNNDGLLVNYIASVDKISYDNALKFIQSEVKNGLKKIKLQTLSFDKIGSFNLVNNQLIFEPQQKTNYLTSSFGLKSVVQPKIKRVAKKEPIILVPNKPKKSNDYLKYAAIFIIGLSVIALGNKFYDYNKNNTAIATAKIKQEIINQKIESATFIISKALPILNLDLVRQKKSFHVIGGAFRFPENATKKVNQLINEGYDARILGINKWNLSIVSYESFSTENEARKTLFTIKNSVEKDAWLLVQEF